MARARSVPRDQTLLAGQMTDARDSWVKTNRTEFVLYVTDDDKITLSMGQGQRTMRMTLTALTEDELIAMRTFLNRALALTQPIVQRLDTEAREAFDNGDDSHIRIYRPAAQLIIRERRKTKQG